MAFHQVVLASHAASATTRRNVLHYEAQFAAYLEQIEHRPASLSELNRERIAAFVRWRRGQRDCPLAVGVCYMVLCCLQQVLAEHGVLAEALAV